MDSQTYHIRIYLDSSIQCDAGYFDAEYNVRLSAEELIAFNTRVADIQGQIDKDHERREKQFRARVRQTQREGKSIRDLRTPHKQNLSVQITLLSQSVIDAAKLMANFEETVKRESLEYTEEVDG